MSAPRSPRPVAVLLVALTAALAGCTGGGDPQRPTGTESDSAPNATPEQRAAGDDAVASDGSVDTGAGRAGPSDADGPEPPSPSSPPSSATRTVIEVQVRDGTFSPASVEIAPGVTVRWTNVDDSPHTVTASDRAWDSGTIDAGGTYERTFDMAGSVGYVCLFHREMQGTIHVVEPAAEGDASAGPTEGGGSPGGDAQGGDEVAIRVLDDRFAPASLSVSPGTRVTWVNDGRAAHTVTDRRDAFDSGTLSPGASFAFVFTSSGGYEYRCEFHSDMRATIRVE